MTGLRLATTGYGGQARGRTYPPKPRRSVSG